MLAERALVDEASVLREDVTPLVGAVLEILLCGVADLAVVRGEGEEVLVVGLEVPEVGQLQAEHHGAAVALVVERLSFIWVEHDAPVWSSLSSN